MLVKSIEVPLVEATAVPLTMLVDTPCTAIVPVPLGTVIVLAPAPVWNARLPVVSPVMFNAVPAVVPAEIVDAI
jgi:hypothetical protein